ncbi:transmembrane protein, putative [Medicago truncatula]|uniref:Transmembrane protein, putative n=1 Tax=Medicago truncatula TaxID=3880 RepID=A0A072TMG3_MEDTR|nr:transmembrane protein, putative [Medicago truncatula]
MWCLWWLCGGGVEQSWGGSEVVVVVVLWWLGRESEMFEWFWGGSRSGWLGCVVRFPAAEGVSVVVVAASLSFTINPPSTNSQIVCDRKDRGGWGLFAPVVVGFRFCLFAPVIGVV